MEKVLADEGVSDTIDPWVHLKPNANAQTGGDWFRLFLAASLGGKAVHGANTSPSCEVLCKITQAQCSDDNYGMLCWDDTVKAPSVLGKKISDQFYTHPLYRGNITSSGSILAYESGLWEPSVRKRARSSALLAAGLVVHGMTSTDACRVVSKITGEPIDIQAVDNAIIPASHLKREMVLVSKASHRVFSQGTLQAGITWFDDKLHSKTGAQNMAFDWGRITAIARYIAEANIQNCKDFRYRAKHGGIPFTVVRNSWAYVSDADYYLPLHIFDRVPSIDLAKVGVPSLVGTFIGHEQEVMLALNRGAKYLDVVPENEAFKGYIALHQAAKQRASRRKKYPLPLPSTAREVNITEHSFSENELIYLLNDGLVIKDAFLQAIASRRSADPHLDALLLQVGQAEDGDSSVFTEIDEATKIIYDRPTWLLARAIAESTLKEKDDSNPGDRSEVLDNLNSKLLALKTHLVGYRSSLEVNLYLSTSQVTSLRPQTVVYARKSSEVRSTVTYSQRTLASQQVRATAQALGNLGVTGDLLIRRLKDEVAPLFEKWSMQVAEDEDDEIRENLAYFAYVCSFIQVLTPSLCYQKNSGYFDGMIPRHSYVYQGMLRTATDYYFVPPKLQRLAYADAFQMARELDETEEVPYSVVSAISETLRIADMIVGDLLEGKVWKPDAQLYLDAMMKYSRQISPPYGGSIMEDAEAEDVLAQLMKDMEENRRELNIVGYEQCLNSYPSLETANEMAQANGFPDLRAAFDVIGKDAYNYEGNDFVIKGSAKIAQSKAINVHSDDAPSSSRKRAFDQVI